MERYDFKGDFTNSVFRLMKNIYVSSTVFSAIFTLLLILISYILFSDIGNYIEEAKYLFEDAANGEDTQSEIQLFIQNFYIENLYRIIPLFVLNLIIASLIYNGLYSNISSEVKAGESSIQNAFNGMLDKRIIHLVILMVILTVSYQVLNYLSGLTGSSVVAFFFSLILGPIYYWLQLSYAYASLGEYSFKESLKLAHSEMTFERLAKVLGIGILISIILMVLFLFIGLILMALSGIPAVLAVIGSLVFIAILGLIISFTVSGYSGLYYRYTVSLKTEEEFLVTD